jgi:hypothetical protein
MKGDSSLPDGARDKATLEGGRAENNQVKRQERLTGGNYNATFG